jgi:aryl-alcohol dehydrogenase-like predicted oxidoreductase
VANQLPYSLVERGIDREIRNFCVTRNIGIMVYSPLAKGLLSAKYSRENLPPPVDDRHEHHFKPQTLARFLAVAEGVQSLSNELGVTPSVLALAWCLAQPGIDTVLPGAKSPAQLLEAATAADLDVSSSILKRLHSISIPADPFASE